MALRVPASPPPRPARAAALALAAALGAGEAAAGAWTQPEGDGVVIFSSGRSAAPITALAGGIPERDKVFLQVFGEYGVLDGLTVGGSLFGDISTVDLVSGSASAALFARKRIYRDDHGYVASVQVGGALPFESLLSDTFGRSKPDSTPEFRVNLITGRSWYGDWGSAWTSSSTGYALRTEGMPDEIRGAFTIAYEPWHCCIAIFDVFTTQPLSGGLDSGSLKIGPSLAWRIWPEVPRNAAKPDGKVRPTTFQLGLSYDVMDADEGVGFMMSVWKQF